MKASDDPKFETWTPENLVKFAYDINAKAKEQSETIASLQQDLKTAITAYRKLIKDTDHADTTHGT